jgi:hypothetical protein
MTLDQAAAPDSAPSQDIPGLAARILEMRRREQRRLRKIRRYMRGHHDRIYVPEGAASEYELLLKASRVNFLPLVVSVVAQNLHVDGYRPTAAADVVDDVVAALAAAHEAIGRNAPDEAADIIATAHAAHLRAQAPVNDGPEDMGPWKVWTANQMESRQHGLHRAVCEYGIAYVLVLPGDPGPVMRPVSPRRMTALYADDVNDEWPIYAVEERIVTVKGGQQRRIVRLFDDQSVYTMTGAVNSPRVAWPEGADLELLDGKPVAADHGLGVCPVVRYQHQIDLDGESDVTGEVEPLIPLQDGINNTSFSLKMAEQYGAFRQRWASGIKVTDEEGRPVEPWRPGVDKLWGTESAAAKFGEFSATDLAPFIGSREASIRHMSTISQVPPYHLLGALVNLSADALIAARDGLDRKIDELQGTLAEPHKQTLRLGGKAAGDLGAWDDLTAVIVWRDTGGKNFSAVVDALGKLSQMLGVPATELWQKVPGATADDIARWTAAASKQGALAELDQMLERQITKGAMPPGAASAGGAPPGDSNPSAAEPWQTDVLHEVGV